MKSLWIGGAALLLALTLALLWWSLRDASIAATPPTDPREDVAPNKRVAPAVPLDLVDGDVAISVQDDMRTESSSSTQRGPVAIERQLPSGTLRGRAVDRVSRAPLPEYLLNLRDEAGRSADVMTDAEGKFVAPEPMAYGAIRVRAFDDPPPRRAALANIAVEHSASEQREVEIRVPTGPTFRLAIDPITAATHELEARLGKSGEFRPVRDGNPRWVRLSQDARRGGKNRKILEVRSPDGLWFGEADTTASSELGREVVAVRLESRAVLTGHVLDVGWNPIEGAQLVLRVLDDAKLVAERSMSTGADGAYRFDFIPSGRAAVRVRALGFAEQKDVNAGVLSGIATTQDVFLTRLPSAGAISGRVTSDTGTFRVPLKMSLVALPSEKGRELRRATPVVWIEEGGRRVGTFRFTDLPAGKYRVSTRGTEIRGRHHYTAEWDPAEVETSPPDAAVNFIIRDREPRANVAVRIVSARTGTPIEDASLFIEVQGTDARYFERWRDLTLLGVPYQTPIRWRVARRGCQPVFGDERSFQLSATKRDETRRLLDVVLQPGWGDMFRVLEHDSRTPISGARVLVDGRVSGLTDASGSLLVLEQQMPRELRFESGRWSNAHAIDLERVHQRRGPLYYDVLLTLK